MARRSDLLGEMRESSIGSNDRGTAWVFTVNSPTVSIEDLASRLGAVSKAGAINTETGIVNGKLHYQGLFELFFRVFNLVGYMVTNKQEYRKNLCDKYPGMWLEAANSPRAGAIYAQKEDTRSGDRVTWGIVSSRAMAIINKYNPDSCTALDIVNVQQDEECEDHGLVIGSTGTSKTGKPSYGLFPQVVVDWCTLTLTECMKKWPVQTARCFTNAEKLNKRYAPQPAPFIPETLSESPAIWIQGQSNAGKTKLAEKIMRANGYHYITKSLRDDNWTGYIPGVTQGVIFDDISARQINKDNVDVIKNFTDVMHFSPKFLYNGHVAIRPKLVIFTSNYPFSVVFKEWMNEDRILVLALRRRFKYITRYYDPELDENEPKIDPELIDPFYEDKYDAGFGYYRSDDELKVRKTEPFKPHHFLPEYNLQSEAMRNAVTLPPAELDVNAFQTFVQDTNQMNRGSPTLKNANSTISNAELETIIKNLDKPLVENDDMVESPVTQTMHEIRMALKEKEIVPKTKRPLVTHQPKVTVHQIPNSAMIEELISTQPFSTGNLPPSSLAPWDLDPFVVPDPPTFRTGKVATTLEKQTLPSTTSAVTKPRIVVTISTSASSMEEDVIDSDNACKSRDVVTTQLEHLFDNESFSSEEEEPLSDLDCTI